MFKFPKTNCPWTQVNGLCSGSSGKVLCSCSLVLYWMTNLIFCSAGQLLGGILDTEISRLHICLYAVCNTHAHNLSYICYAEGVVHACSKCTSLVRLNWAHHIKWLQHIHVWAFCIMLFNIIIFFFQIGSSRFLNILRSSKKYDQIHFVSLDLTNWWPLLAD